MRGTSQGPDIYFQLVESANRDYLAIPGIVQAGMDAVGKLTGRQYHIFDYVGAPDAVNIVVVQGAAASTVEEVVALLNGKGGKVGVLKVRLFRPWNAEAFLAAIPKTVQVKIIIIYIYLYILVAYLCS
jgi:pyruvate-ferredoxin/flavodoxin oxidoreductase